MSIRIGILGYGNLGRGVECAVRQNRIWIEGGIYTKGSGTGKYSHRECQSLPGGRGRRMEG